MDFVLMDFVADLLQMMSIPYHLEALPFQNTSTYDKHLREKILGFPNAAERLNRALSGIPERTVVNRTDLFQCNYIVLRLPDTETVLSVGPLLYERIYGERFEEIFQVLRLPEHLRDALAAYYCDVKFLPNPETVEDLCLLTANYLYGKGQYQVVYENEAGLLDEYQLYENLLRVPEQPFVNLRFLEERYEAENALLRAVSSGEEALAVECAKQFFAKELPLRLSSPMRDRKDLLITLNTLLRKQAEASGVHPIHIDSHSNHNIQEIEQLFSMEQINAFRWRMVRGYCRLIREYTLADYSLPIRRAITYIRTDLTADLSLKALAEQTQISPGYLSALFKKEVGMPLTDYVNRQRISYAKQLLISTTLPVKSIALQCGIPNMYYFSRMFKRIAGVTPKSYRDGADYHAETFS